MGIFDNPFVVFAVALVVQWGALIQATLFEKSATLQTG